MDLNHRAAATAKSLKSCLTLCDPIDGSPPGSAVPGILQARTLEWVAISFSNACKWKVKVKSLSRVWLSATPWTAVHQAPLSMGFSRQEYWSGVPLLLRITELVNRKSKIYTLVYQFAIHILLIAMTKYCSILSFLWGEWYKNVKELFLLIRNHKAVHLNASTKSSEATWQYDIFKRTVLFPKQKRKSLKAIFLVSVSNFGLEIFVLKCVKL